RRDVLAAERVFVLRRFFGSRAPYLSALTRAWATLAAARGAIGDELRRRALEERLAPRRTASAGEVTQFLGTYGSVLAREVEVEPAPSWLPSGRGVALATELPPEAFSAATGGALAIRTLDGLIRVRVTGETVPLATIPLAQARPAVIRALRSAAKADAYRSWSWRRQHTVLEELRCVRDRLPAVGGVELSSFLPFLSLGAG
ncbi:MAG: hypothetical protein ACR2GT_04800, partial [Gaiellaceae bacterium]